MSSDRRQPPGLGAVADLLQGRVEQILEGYEGRLQASGNPLAVNEQAHPQLRAQALAILDEVANTLRGRVAASSQVAPERDTLSLEIGAFRALEGVHPSDSLRAAAALFDAVMSTVFDPATTARMRTGDVVDAARVLQRSITERVATASEAYVNYLLDRVRESHADERRRLGRELHDRVAHAIMVVFRNLELYQMYRAHEPARALPKIELAKQAAQDALATARSLSSELRSLTTEDGLEVALSEYLRATVPPGLQARVSAKGNEDLVTLAVRDELFLILREAIRNALLYADAQRMDVELDIEDHRVLAAVDDDGCGFDREQADASRRGTGLISMKERADLLGGTLRVVSSQGGGTRVEVLVPLPASLR